MLRDKSYGERREKDRGNKHSISKKGSRASSKPVSAAAVSISKKGSQARSKPVSAAAASISKEGNQANSKTVSAAAARNKAKIKSKPVRTDMGPLERARRAEFKYISMKSVGPISPEKSRSIGLWVISNTIFLKWSTLDWSTLQKSVQKIQTKRLQKIFTLFSGNKNRRNKVLIQHKSSNRRSLMRGKTVGLKEIFYTWYNDTDEGKQVREGRVGVVGAVTRRPP